MYVGVSVYVCIIILYISHYNLETYDEARRHEIKAAEKASTSAMDTDPDNRKKTGRGYRTKKPTAKASKFATSSSEEDDEEEETSLVLPNNIPQQKENLVPNEKSTDATPTRQLEDDNNGDVTPFLRKVIIRFIKKS